MKERGRGGVVQNFQTGGRDPAKQVICERVRGNESVPRWVVSIEVSEDESVRGVLPKALHKGRVRSARSPGPKLERQKSRSETGASPYPSNDLFCLSFSLFFGKDTFALRSGF